jgi:bifunctional UDP-N-acetylglucosamine pyrophosphorylase/glucosamine-1-phosphate N-acetyltransferase
MTKSSVLVVVLAAGKGTRMKSALPKVLHKVAGRSMLGHVLDLTAAIGAAKVAVVVGSDMADVAAEAVRCCPGVATYLQSDQRGTADAVLAAREALANHDGDVIVLYADTPLIRAATVGEIRAKLDNGSNIAVLGFRPVDPAGYGRLLTDTSGELLAIREEKDASDAVRQVNLCNSGVMAFRVENLLGLLERIGNDNAKKEYYLTDVVGIARQDGLRAAVVECDESEVLGVNSRNQLAVAEAIWQSRARQVHMANGVTMIAPETVFLSYDTQLACDVTIEPNVFFGPGVTVESGTEILGNCHFTGAHIGANVRIGPFARLRPGAKLGNNVHVGNFVELKNTTMADGAKANHLAYLGDGIVGAKANVGAGTIFCNYDGFNKHKTELGAGAFIGSNSSLVAPVKIGAGAYIGSGSVITKDVAEGALALERTAQEERPGWAEKFRIMMSRRKGKS